MVVNKPLTYDPPKVIGVPDSDIDPEGHIPTPLLLTGIEVVVPLWPEPAKEPLETDTLTVCFEQAGQTPVRIPNTYKPEDMRPEFIIRIGPEHLKNNGPGELWYELVNSAGNPSESYKRRLTIDHTPVPVDLKEARFTHADMWGYLYCKTDPPLWEGVNVEIPALQGFNVGDRCEVLWRGYSTLNGSGPEIDSARKTVIRSSLSDQDIREGYSLVIEPYETHIKPMVNNDSATVVYRVFRGAKLVGSSKIALVKIDRIVSGDELPCGP
ncbi:hypothetical protein MO767_26015 [Pseudomonas sp. UYIF39]|uniref:hypothetical protein n=1 Tax=Pseudomonas sp. UYIF39 TaxID=1630747 RepID=UPI00249DB3D1|nr:hypothetical protein [Pseudomonas sp. UYIF39]MDI3357781.1 hypothetical protein [Pseudomonas sp. UYIF39]